jgi:hypothetical protein
VKAIPLIITGVKALVITIAAWQASKAIAKGIDVAVTSSQTQKNEPSPTPLYRAVGQAELESIVNSGGQFSMGDGSSYESGKLFTTEYSDALNYAIDANKSIAQDNPYVAVVQTTAEKGTYVPIPISDAPSAVIVPKENIHTLTPGTVVSSIGE